VSIGQLVADEAAAPAAAGAGKKKKRRSKEEGEPSGGAGGDEDRLNRSAHRRRVHKLQEKAEVCNFM